MSTLETLNLRTNRLRNARWIAYLVVLLSILFAPMAYGQSGGPSAGVLDDTLISMQGSISTWEGGIRSSLQTLFYYAALLEFTFALLMYMLKGRDEGQEFGSLIVRQVVVISAFAALLQFGPSIMGVLIEGLARVGQVGGSTGNLTPSSVLIVGIDSMFLINDQVSEAAWWQRQSGLGLAGFLLSMTMLAMFAWMAFQLMLLLLQAYMVMIAGLVFVAFGVNRLFRFTMQGYISYAFSTGVHLMFLYLILGLAMNAAQTIVPMVLGDGSIDGLLDRMMLATALVFMLAMLVHKVPSLAASAISGAPNLSTGDALAAGAAGGAVALGVGAAATGGIGAAAGVAKGAVQAAVAGNELATASGASGIKAMAQGFGHAARATGSEAVAGLRSGAGFGPSSPHATDTRGREVPNIGTRAANALQTEKQALGEAGPRSGKASSPVTGASGAAGTSGSAAGVSQTSGSTVGQGVKGPESVSGAGAQQIADAGSSVRNVAPPPAAADSATAGAPPIRFDEAAPDAGSGPGSSYEAPQGGGLRDALTKLQAPNLPSDQSPGAGGTIQFQLDPRDD